MRENSPLRSVALALLVSCAVLTATVWAAHRCGVRASLLPPGHGGRVYAGPIELVTCGGPTPFGNCTSFELGYEVELGPLTLYRFKRFK